MVKQSLQTDTERNPEELVGEAIYSHKYQSATSAAYYDDVIYASSTHDSAMWEVEQRMLREILGRHCPDHASARALDFACGPGRISRFMEPLVGQLVGVDISEQMLERARASGLRCQLVCANITECPQDVPGEMDIILAFRFLLLANPDLRQACIAQLTKKLKSDASIMILNSHGNPTSYRALASLRDRLLRPSKARLPSFSFTDMNKLAAECGLELVDVRGVGLIPRSLARVIPRGLFVALESLFARMPLIWRMGTHLFFVLRRRRVTE
jgi:predicted TPR repeat methyltransferase